MAASPPVPPQLDFSPPPLVSICHRKTPLLATASNGHVTGHLARETATTTAVAKRENNSIASDSAPPHRSPPPPPLPPLLPPLLLPPLPLPPISHPFLPHRAPTSRGTVLPSRLHALAPCGPAHCTGTAVALALAPHSHRTHRTRTALPLAHCTPTASLI